MSTGLNCSFIEVEPGKWYYLLEQGCAPKTAWDWREHADAYGPFPTEDAADTHLRENHANPGGCDVQHYVDGFKPDAVLERLIRSATATLNHTYGFRFRY